MTTTPTTTTKRDGLAAAEQRDANAMAAAALRDRIGNPRHLFGRDPVLARAAMEGLERLEESDAALSAQALAGASWGEQFTASPAWQHRDGNGVTRGAVQLGRFLEERADGQGLRPGRVAPDLAPIAGRCQPYPSDRLTVDFPRFTGVEVQAERVPETQPKPVADLPVAVVTGRLEFLAGGLHLSRQKLDDHRVLAQIIDTALRRAVALEIDRAVVDALTTDADIDTVPAGTADLLPAVSAAGWQLRAAGYAGPLTVIGAPEVLARPWIDQTLPGDCELLPAGDLAGGQVIVADLAACVLLATKGSTMVLTTDSNVDNFVKNSVTLLAELPAAALVSDPGAAVIVTAG